MIGCTIYTVAWHSRPSEQPRVLLCTRIPLKVEIILRVTPALAPRVRVPLRTMLERLVSVPNVVEKVDLVLFREQRRSDRMHRRIPPTFIVKPTGLVEVVEKVKVGL